MDQLIQPAQLKRLHTLLSKAGISDKEQKRELISNISAGRTISSKGLTAKEADMLMSYLIKSDPQAEGITRMRRNIIAMAHEIGWRAQRDGAWVADMNSINSWCEKYSSLKKPLNDFKYEELPALVTQFKQGPYKHFITNI
jgi:hypothetical protein